MNTVIRACVAVGVAVLAGCNGKSGSSDGFVGTWHVDVTPLVEAQKPALVEMVKTQAALMKEKLKELDALPADQKERAMAMIWDQVPPEQRELTRAMMKGEKEGTAAAIKMLESQVSAFKAVVDIKADKTWSHDFAAGDNKETGTGTWSADGSTITLTPKTKDGAPVAGDDAKTMVLTLKDGKLEGKHPKTGEPVVLKR